MLKKFSTYSVILLFISWVPTKIEANDKFDLLIGDTENTTISLLTCDPGNEIYSLFGHSALRIQNPSQSINWVINWGLFEFNENQLQFGYDFAKGRLNYYMGVQEISSFIYEYSYYKRGVREQILNINTINKKKLIALIQENYRPEKRNYQYEFFYDNCSSRIRDILVNSIGDELKWANHSDANEYTYRQIIHQYLKYDPWLELGIDLVLGSKIDVVVDNQHLMFLPDYLESIVDQSTLTNDNAIKAKNLVGLKRPIIISDKKTRETYNISIYAWLSLLITFSLLILKKEKLFNIWTSTNLLITGILGVLLVFMWWGTDHSGTKYNLNLLWASPFNLLLVGVIIFKKWNKFSFIYIIITGIFLFSTILFWFTMAQELNPFVKPIIISLCLMYYYYFRKNKILINLPQTKD